MRQYSMGSSGTRSEHLGSLFITPIHAETVRNHRNFGCQPHTVGMASQRMVPHFLLR